MDSRDSWVNFANIKNYPISFDDITSKEKWVNLQNDEINLAMHESWPRKFLIVTMCKSWTALPHSQKYLNYCEGLRRYFCHNCEAVPEESLVQCSSYIWNFNEFNVNFLTLELYELKYWICDDAPYCEKCNKNCFLITTD